MRYFICDKKANYQGQHLVHTLFCPSLPHENRRQIVGRFDNCKQAIEYLYSLNKDTGFKFIGCKRCNQS